MSLPGSVIPLTIADRLSRVLSAAEISFSAVGNALAVKVFPPTSPAYFALTMSAPPGFIMSCVE
jgi:hypothetical protein